MDVLTEVRERLSIFKDLYDHIRIVDPERKIVLGSYEDECRIQSSVKGANCYEVWNRSGMCKNCVSYRALYDGRTVSKFERSGDRMYWTVATPCEFEGKTYIVEFLKDIVEDSLVDQNYRTYMPLHSTVMTLNDLANTDGLTNVFNRRYINKQLPVEIDKAKFHDEDLSVLLIDLDHFKKINDTYGHLAGDEVLIRFAKSIIGNMRQEVDWVGRYGGEEFMVVLNRTSLVEARYVAERIRRFVESEIYEVEGNMIKMTCSIGVATSEKGMLDSNELLKRADERLYRAKVAGRNQVRIN